jgi:hypothetical protein
MHCLRRGFVQRQCGFTVLLAVLRRVDGCVDGDVGLLGLPRRHAMDIVHGTVPDLYARVLCSDCTVVGVHGMPHRHL